MRSSSEIQKEYDDLKHKSQGAHDQDTDKVYAEAIRRAKLEEQARDQRDFEARIDKILHGDEPASPIPFIP